MNLKLPFSKKHLAIALSAILIFSLILTNHNSQEDGNSNFTFAVTGHVYPSQSQFEFILQDLNTSKIKNLFVAGDIGKNIIEKFSAYEQNFGVRITPVPGNHEIQDKKGADSFYKTFGNYKAIEIDGLHFLALNTNSQTGPPFPHGGSSISGAQLAFVKEHLQELKGKPVIIIMHHAFWSLDLTEKEKKKMARELKMNPAYDITEIQFPSNDTTPNTWMAEIHPLLVKHGNAHVFAGDASLSTVFEKGGVRYYTTGLRQKEKGDWVQGNLQSYIVCSAPGKSTVNCTIKYFNEEGIQKSKDLTRNFSNALESLSRQPVQHSENLSLANNEPLKETILGTRYIVIEKGNDTCKFPKADLQVWGEGIYEKSKSFGNGITISDRKKLYFLSNRESEGSSINQVLLYRYLSPPDECKKYKVSFYNHHFNSEFEAFKNKLPAYSLQIEDSQHYKLLNSVPTEKGRYQSEFRFAYFPSQFNDGNKTYRTRMKMRGGTKFHWAGRKKSYTVKFENMYKGRKKILFYIPEKRSFTGEYLVNKLAGILKLESLNADFGYLKINGEDHGIYYVTEDFDKYFLEKRKFPEANIYNTDPYKVGNTFDVNDIKKEMILSTIKAYKNDFEKDTEFFLSAIKIDLNALKKKWTYYFNPDNLGRMLALYTITGVSHYDIHNTVFYINPAEGRIYFFPWDFMNYTHAGKLKRDDLKNVNNDYLNFNPILSKLLEIPEIRNLRNKVIYHSGDQMISYLNEFRNSENIALFANFFTDHTSQFYAGEGNRPSLPSLMEIPSTIIRNIEYLKEKILKINVDGYLKSEENTLTIFIRSNSFSGLRLKKVSVNGGSGQIPQIILNEAPLSDSDFSWRNPGSKQVISFHKNVALAPRLNYEKKYAAKILLEPSFLSIALNFTTPQNINDVILDFENISTGAHKKIALSSFQPNFQPVQKINGEKSEEAFKHPLLKPSSEKNAFTFLSRNVSLKETLVIPKNIKLFIQPGTTIVLAKDVSLISYGEIRAKGTKNEPIIFTGSNNDSWGVLGLLQEKAKGEFEHCVFQRGSHAKVNNVYFSGMLSAHYTGGVKIKNCKFQLAGNDGGDDAVNIKGGMAIIENNYFLENKFDALDLDFVKKGSLVMGNKFLKNGNDGIDISASEVSIKNNFVEQSGDKCISAGEKSIAFISKNILKDCFMGIAIKDSSEAIVSDNEILGNKIGVAGYNKKPIFGGGKISVFNTLFQDNEQDFGLEVINRSADFRYGDSRYASQCVVYSSKYVLSDKISREVTKASRKGNISKKKLLKAYASENWEEIGYKVTDLRNRVIEGVERQP